MLHWYTGSISHKINVINSLGGRYTHFGKVISGLTSWYILIHIYKPDAACVMQWYNSNDTIRPCVQYTQTYLTDIGIAAVTFHGYKSSREEQIKWCFMNVMPVNYALHGN